MRCQYILYFECNGIKLREFANSKFGRDEIIRLRGEQGYKLVRSKIRRVSLK